MTYAPPTLKAARALLVDNLDMHPGSGSYPADLDPSEVGIVSYPDATIDRLQRDCSRLEPYGSPMSEALHEECYLLERRMRPSRPRTGTMPQALRVCAAKRPHREGATADGRRALLVQGEQGPPRRMLDVDRERQQSRLWRVSGVTDEPGQGAQVCIPDACRTDPRRPGSGPRVHEAGLRESRAPGADDAGREHPSGLLPVRDRQMASRGHPLPAGPRVCRREPVCEPEGRSPVQDVSSCAHEGVAGAAAGGGER